MSISFHWGTVKLLSLNVKSVDRIPLLFEDSILASNLPYMYDAVVLISAAL